MNDGPQSSGQLSGPLRWKHPGLILTASRLSGEVPEPPDPEISYDPDAFGGVGGFALVQADDPPMFLTTRQVERLVFALGRIQAAGVARDSRLLSDLGSP